VAGHIQQGDIVWLDFGDPRGSEPGFRRPAIVIQSDEFNHSRIGTILCVPLTSNLHIANVPGNLLLRKSETGLDRDSVANVAQISAQDRSRIGECIGSIPERRLQALFRGLDLVLGR
jgi:mRNA interferase MazF